MLKKLGIIFVLLFVILFAHPSFAVTKTPAKTTTTTTTTTTTPSAPASGDQQINDVKKIIGKDTPSFLSVPVIWIVNLLENFRINYFSSPFVFYGFFLVILFYILRYLWRFFF